MEFHDASGPLDSMIFDCKSTSRPLDSAHDDIFSFLFNLEHSINFAAFTGEHSMWPNAAPRFGIFGCPWHFTPQQNIGLYDYIIKKPRFLTQLVLGNDWLLYTWYLIMSYPTPTENLQYLFNPCLSLGGVCSITLLSGCVIFFWRV